MPGPVDESTDPVAHQDVANLDGYSAAMTNQLWDRELAKVFFDIFAESLGTNPAKVGAESAPSIESTVRA